jgi:type IV pilus assembly protein PilX
MISRGCSVRSGVQRGFVLVSSLLLLVVVTIIALSMFRSFGVQEKIAGNMREKQRALQAAESAQQFAEWWLGVNGNATSSPVACAGLLNANVGEGQICSPATALSLMVPDITSVPWQAAGVDIGVQYVPPLMNVTTTSAANTYYFAPRFYISDMGASADPNIPGEIYQIDAVGYGGSASTAAVVESTYAVYVSSSNRTL